MPSLRRWSFALAALVAAGCTTSDSVGPRNAGGLEVSVPVSLLSFTGLVVEQVHVQVYRPTGVESRELVLDDTIPFSVERNTLNLSLDIPMAQDAETLDVNVDLATAAGRVLFSSGGSYIVTRGSRSSSGQLSPFFYQGPGSNVYQITVTPPTPVVQAGGTLDFSVTAVDTNGGPVDTVYTSWHAAAGRINALGHFTAPATAGTVYVTAATPNGKKDSTLVTVVTGTSTAITGRVVSGASGGPLQGVTVKVVSSAGDTVATLTTGADGSYTTPPVAPGNYIIVAALNGYVTAVAFNTDATGGATTAPVIPLAPATQTPGNLTGGVSDATTGGTISGPTLELRAGVNATTGTPLATTTGDTAGVYFFFNIPAGTYTVTASAPGYVGGSVTVVVLGNQSQVTAPGINLSPVGAEVARIVLTWGADPSDLDAHLTGPDSTTGTRFHVYFGDQGRLDSLPHAALDIDNTSGFGPETITLTKQFAGVYRFSVHDYTNSDLTSSTALANSGARVQLYLNGALAHEYFVPNQPGTLWTVFELSGSTVRAVNTMTYQPNSDAVTIRVPGSAPAKRISGTWK
ncbi:MAG TPA: carboxypeptidase regulatory-like domain-containing protein [Gemmatimonadales bacterium]|nr:carboxypeptidase regulatory-like domain-containing protein [Gemmatimonadales bacterium]